MPRATIVLLTKNAEPYLQETLEAIFHQETPYSFEVLAIDSGSKDRTLDILADYPLRILTILPEAFNHGETRNLGAREADPESEFIVFLSQDATPFNNLWLHNLITPLIEDRDVAGVFSRHVPRPGASASTVRQLTQLTQSGGHQRLVKKMPPSPEEYEAKKFDYIFFSNTSSAIRRSVWQVVPFEPVDFAEDAVWADRVLRKGYSLVFEPTSVITHSHNYNMMEQFRQNADHAHAMDVHFRPVFYHDCKTWLKLFLGIPLQVCKDCRFVMHDPFFSSAPSWYKVKMMAYSLPWHIATVWGAWVGVHRDRLPPFLRHLTSRQERIKRS